MSYRLTSKFLIVSFFFFPFLAFGQSVELLPIPTAPAGSSTKTESVESLIDIDLIVEANTYTPYFYQGRSEPTAGNVARLVAITFGNSAAVASYQWKVGNSRFTTTDPVLQVVLPRISNNVLVSVSALSQGGAKLGSVSEYLSVSEPLLVFYEDNELRGTSRIAIEESLNMIGNEVAVKAEPYFFGEQNLLSGAIGSWTATNVSLAEQNDWRRTSFIRNEEGSATETEVGLNVRSLNNLSETLTGSFILNL